MKTKLIIFLFMLSNIVFGKESKPSNIAELQINSAKELFLESFTQNSNKSEHYIIICKWDSSKSKYICVSNNKIIKNEGFSLDLYLENSKFSYKGIFSESDETKELNVDVDYNLNNMTGNAKISLPVKTDSSINVFLAIPPFYSNKQIPDTVFVLAKGYFLANKDENALRIKKAEVFNMLERNSKEDIDALDKSDYKSELYYKARVHFYYGDYNGARRILYELKTLSPDDADVKFFIEFIEEKQKADPNASKKIKAKGYLLTPEGCFRL